MGPLDQDVDERDDLANFDADVEMELEFYRVCMFIRNSL